MPRNGCGGYSYDSNNVLHYTKSNIEVAVDTRTDDGWSGSTWVYELPLGLHYEVVEDQNPNFLAPLYDSTSELQADKTTVWTLTVNNVRDPLQLAVTKQWEDIKGVTLTPDATFMPVTAILYDAADPTTIIDQVTLNAGNGWQANFKEVDRYDAEGVLIQYALKEVSVSGYTSSYTFDATNNTFDLVNTQIPGSVVLTKVNRDGAVLQGATFELFTKANVSLGTFTSDESGIVAIDELPVGDYYFVETAAPQGYIVDATPIDFTIEFNQAEAVRISAVNQSTEIPNTGVGQSYLTINLIVMGSAFIVLGALIKANRRRSTKN